MTLMSTCRLSRVCLPSGTIAADLARFACVHGVVVMLVGGLVLPQPREVLVLHGYPSLSYRECIPVFFEFFEACKVTIGFRRVRYILEQLHMLPTLRNQVVYLRFLRNPSGVHLLLSRVSFSRTLENP